MSKKRTLGLKLSHHKNTNSWYQMVCQCTFWSDDNNYLFEISRVKIDEADTKTIFEELAMKKYRESDEVEYFGTPDVCKVYKSEDDGAERLKKRMSVDISMVAQA